MLMAKRLLFATYLLTLCSMVVAQPRSESVAMTIARDFLSASNDTKRSAPANAIDLKLVPSDDVKEQLFQHPFSSQTASLQELGFYVFNDVANHRFVIVSGDKRQYETLGSSDYCVFDPENVPCGLQTFLEQYAKEYAYLQRTPVDENSTSTEPVNRRAYSNVSPLIKTKWGQGSPYNDQCPYAKGTRCVTGCVATAMAQVMNYYQFPERGEGVVKRIPGQNYLSSDALDLSAKAFDWNSMQGLQKITSSSSSSAKSAVAYLMKACGYAVKMNYGTSAQGGSGAYAGSFVVPALTRYFGYKTTAVVRERSDYYSSWESMIQEELSNGRPIIYCGYGTGGHCFILDGYQSSTGKYYFNWGWNGSYDGAFYFSSLRPGSENFTNNQMMICRISPDDNISIEKPVINIDTDNDVATITCSTEGVKLYYSFTPQDQSYESSYTRYNGEKLSITCNGTFRAYAELQSKKQYASQRSVSWFAVYRPEFYPEGNYVTIKCPSATAIYYTMNGSTPTKSSAKYTGAIYCSGNKTIKAIGVKANYTTSSVATLDYRDEIQTVYNITNTAGHLSEKISYKNWYNVISLTVSGQLNKDDMSFITATLAQSGELTRLDMKNASLVGDGTEYLPDNALKGYAFFDCSKITSIILPSNLKIIGYSAFEGCTSLTQIDIPEGCTKIGDHAFAGSGLTSLTIPKNVESIEWGFVADCKYLTSLTVDKSNKIYDSRDNCNAIIKTADNEIIAGCKRTVIPSTVKLIDDDAFGSSPKVFYIEGIYSIGYSAFENNTELEEVTIEEGCVFLGYQTFKNCTNLKIVSIPKTIDYATKCFQGCTSLKTFSAYHETPFTIADSFFEGSNYKNATLRVPYGCKAKYQAAAVWKDFGKIEEMDPVVNSIAEAKALQDDQYATLVLNDVQVTYAYPDVIDYAYIRDKSGAGRLFGSNFFTKEGLNIKTGDVLSGSIPIRKSSTGSIQVISHKFEPRKFSVVDNKQVEPKLISSDAIRSEENENELVTVEGVVINAGTDYLHFYDSEKRFVSLSPIGGLEPEEYEAILAETKDKDLSKRRFTLTGIPHWQSSLYLTRPAKDIGPAEYEKGTAENPLTPAEANALAGALAANQETDKDYYIHGFVYSIKEQFGTQNGNATFYLSSDGTDKDQFYIYRALYLGNTKYAGQDLLLQVGDEVVVCGKLVNYLGSLPETVQEKAYVVSINGTTTGIEEVTTDSDASDTPVYNLRGQRLTAPQKGINIIGGKKLVVK